MILTNILAILAAAGGLGMIWTGWRGRKVDDTPRCRKCSHILSNAPESQQRCPKCDAWLDLPGAVVKGRLLHRMSLVVTGVVLTFAGGIWLVGAALVSSHYVDPYRFKPQASLVRDFRAGDERAWVELQRRFAAGSLQDDSINALVDAILATQADPKANWTNRLGDFLESARLAGRVSDDRWLRYVDQALVMEMQLRPRLRRGDPMPVGLSVSQTRTGRALGMSIAIRPKLLAGPLVVHDRPLAMPFNWPPLLGMWQAQDVLDPSELLPEGVADGRQLVTAEIAIQADLGPVQSKVVKRLQRPCELVPASAPAAEQMNDPDLTNFLTSRVRVNVWKDHVEITLPTLDMNVVFEVIVRDGLDTQRLGTVIFPACSDIMIFTVSRDLVLTKPLSGKRVDVILKSDDRPTVKTLDVLSIWSGEIELKGLQVKGHDSPEDGFAGVPYGDDVIFDSSPSSVGSPPSVIFVPLVNIPMVLAIMLVVAGYVLFYAGWRGRLVDKHPRCRKCAYDLTNRPVDQRRCPECGSWTSVRGAITHGTYEHRSRLVLLGLLAMVAGVLWAVMVLLTTTGTLDVANYLQTWVAKLMKHE